MMRWLGRGIFIAACSLLYYSYYVYFTFVYDTQEAPFQSEIALIIGLVSGLIVMLLDFLYRDKIAKNFFAIFFGLIIGIFFSEQVITFLERFLLLYSENPQSGHAENLGRSPILPMIPIIYLIISYMSVMVMLNAKESMRFIIPFVSLKDETRSTGGLMLESSVLIDGRVVELCKSMIVDSRIFIPKIVINELQAIADSSNKLKRLRGRRGLEVVKKLKALKEIDLEILDEQIRTPMPLDEKLVQTALLLKARLVTNDFNLLKVAQIHGVEVVNINDIANAMKVNLIVGEPLEIEILKEGENEEQGIGFLPDGTMVVVEGARQFVGAKVKTTVTNIYNRETGKIVFAKVVLGEE